MIEIPFDCKNEIDFNGKINTIIKFLESLKLD